MLRNSESVAGSLTMGDIAPKFWPVSQYPAGPIGFVPPEALPAIVEGFLRVATVRMTCARSWAAISCAWPASSGNPSPSPPPTS